MHEARAVITRPLKRSSKLQFPNLNDKEKIYFAVKQFKGLSKKTSKLRGREFIYSEHFVETGVLQMRTSALFGAKISHFSKFMVCPHRQVGLS